MLTVGAGPSEPNSDGPGRHSALRCSGHDSEIWRPRAAAWFYGVVPEAKGGEEGNHLGLCRGTGFGGLPELGASGFSTEHRSGQARHTRTSRFAPRHGGGRLGSCGGRRSVRSSVLGSDGWIDVPDADIGIEAYFYGSRVVLTGLPRAYSYDAFRVRAGNSQVWSGWSDYAWATTTHDMDWGRGTRTCDRTNSGGRDEYSRNWRFHDHWHGPSGRDAHGEHVWHKRQRWAGRRLLQLSVDSQRRHRRHGIPGATSNSYTLVDDDEGKTIKVRVSFTMTRATASR